MTYQNYPTPESPRSTDGQPDSYRTVAEGASEPSPTPQHQTALSNNPPSQAASMANAPTSGLAIAGMVLGIIALATIPLPVINFGSPALAIVGLVLSILGFNSVRKGTKKGKGIAVAGIVLCAIVTVLALLVSAACSAAVSSNDSDNPSNSDAQASPTAASATSAASAGEATPASETSPEATPDYNSAFVGTWDMVEFKSSDASYDEKALSQSRKNGADSYIVLDEDGTAKIVIGSNVSDYTWTATGDSAGSIKGDDLQSSMGVSDDMLVIGSKDSYMLFRKGKARDSLPTEASSASASASAESAESDEVSPDLKEWLDSYEAFVDEYVEFMKRYQESGDTMSMLTEYTDYMQRYSDFVEKSNKVDTNKLSAADYAYYIDVTTRISKKMLEVSGL